MAKRRSLEISAVLENFRPLPRAKLLLGTPRFVIARTMNSINYCVILTLNRKNYQLVLGLNRYSVRILCSAEYQILGNTRSSQACRNRVGKKILNNNSFTCAHIYESKLACIEAQ